MITFFWSLSLLQDLKHRTKLEGIIAAREGNFSQLLILTYCLFKGLSYRILNFPLCFRCLNHIAHKLDFYNCSEVLATRARWYTCAPVESGTSAAMTCVSQQTFPALVCRHPLCPLYRKLFTNSEWNLFFFFYDFLYLITSVTLWIQEMDQFYCTSDLTVAFWRYHWRERWLIFFVQCSVLCKVSKFSFSSSNRPK